MIDPNKVTEAVMEFMDNPTWKGIFMNAPGGAMERLAISFYFSKFHDQFKPEDFQEYRDLRDEYEKSLTEEDLTYLVENSEKDNAKKHYQELLTKLQQGGGQPQGNMRFEKEAATGGSGQETAGTGDGSQPQSEETTEKVEESVQKGEDGQEKVVESETQETPEGEETEKATVVAEEKPAEPAEGDESEKKNDLKEKDEGQKKDEKYNTALSVALEYLQNEQKEMKEKGEK